MAKVGVAIAAAACGLGTVTMAQCTPSSTNLCVTVDSVFNINGAAQAPVSLVRGRTYTFQMVDVIFIHPFYISTDANGGGLGVYTEGVSPTSVSGNQVMSFAVPLSAPSQLYYQCQAHTGMGGSIAIVDPPTCYANCDQSTAAPALNVADFTCFLQRFAAGCP